MKSAYELAMERLNKSSPTVKLTAPQKRALGDLDSRYKAKIAEHEIQIQDDINKAIAIGDGPKIQELEQHLANERRNLQAELEEKKAKIRQTTD